MYWPPAGGGGVQRPLKLATHLPALGIETHVLAPDDPKWLHRDEELRPPTQAFVHRARYLGPKARLPSEELHGLRAPTSRWPRRGSPTAGCCSPTRASPGRRPRCPRGRAHRQQRGDRRRDHDQPAGLDEPDRRRGQAADRDCVGRRPARLGAPERRPPLRRELRAARRRRRSSASSGSSPSAPTASWRSPSPSPTRCAASSQRARCA